MRSVVLLVSTNTRLTFICPILRVTTKESVCGCCSGWEVVASNFMIGPLDVVLGVAAENHVDGSLCVGTFTSSLISSGRSAFLVPRSSFRVAS